MQLKMARLVNTQSYVQDLAEICMLCAQLECVQNTEKVICR